MGENAKQQRALVAVDHDAGSIEIRVVEDPPSNVETELNGTFTIGPSDGMTYKQWRVSSSRPVKLIFDGDCRLVSIEPASSGFIEVSVNSSA